MKHKNNATSTYRCLIAESYRDGNGHEHIGCSCVKEKIAALEAENAKLREAAEAARDMITPVVKEGSHAHERLIEALEKLETLMGKNRLPMSPDGRRHKQKVV